MAKKVVGKRKKPGPPVTTGPGALVGLRCQPAYLEKIDKWRERQPVPPSRPQAIIYLSEVGLEADSKAKKTLIGSI